MNALKSARKERGLSQEEIAEAICVTQSAVHQWESGKSKPTIDNLKKIAKLFNCKVDDLIDK